ncbi:hypothetical protein BDY21DRAFT_85391 [Lineolata rhizophorae]|uniref:Uncharacterized protein n=1 Tax=Lineolata rhizophorae TaxID=578093 RepID=A0A6A6PBP1_9PEZI|nr:hypothetical protein BDY21DRAFT_85391 [Lineolata rhizophorae]
MTIRTRSVASRLANEGDIIAVEPMEAAQAHTLLDNELEHRQARVILLSWAEALGKTMESPEIQTSPTG